MRQRASVWFPFVVFGIALLAGPLLTLTKPKFDAYFNVQSVDVVVGDAGPMVMASAEILQDFQGRYLVELADASGRNVFTPEWSEPFTYSAGNPYQKPETLDWWVGQNVALPPGTYSMKTCWRVDVGSRFADKCVEAPEFEVTE